MKLNPKQEIEHQQVRDAINDICRQTMNNYATLGKQNKEQDNSTVVSDLKNAAKVYLKKIDEESGSMWAINDEEIVNHFCFFAETQREQDKALIGDLLEGFKKINKLCNDEENILPNIDKEIFSDFKELLANIVGISTAYIETYKNK